MNIRSKLSLLTGIILTGALLIIAILLVSLAPVLKIQNEQKVITELRNAESDLSVAALKFPMGYFEDNRSILTKAVLRSNTAFDDLGTLELLPGLSPEIATAVESIARLEALQSGNLKTIDNIITDIEMYLQNTLDSSITFKLKELAENTLIVQKGDVNTVQFKVNNYSNASASLLSVLDMTVKALDMQALIIEKESTRVILRGIIVAGVLAALVILLAIVFSMLMSRRIVSDVLSINRSMLSLEKGKLAKKPTVSSKDEIGELSHALAQFNDSLAGSVRHITSAADESRKTREELTGAAEEASSASAQMQSNTESIEKQINILDESVNNSSTAINGIVIDIKNTDGELEKQSQLVENSSSAIAQMSASIANVGRLTEESGAATRELEEAAQSGGEKLRETTKTVESIREDIAGVRDITSIIQSIASRTNLLAMNAAIEAAHAGDAGRGFAVVADEVRKLAEASAKNSKEITALLAGMISSIHSADEAGQETKTAFDTLQSRVNDVKQASDEIRASMRELEVGSSEISNTMIQLSSVTSRVDESSASMKNQSHSVQEGIGNLGRVSREVSGGIGEISIGLSEVNQSMAYLLELSRKINNVSEELDTAVSVFDLSESEADSADTGN